MDNFDDDIIWDSPDDDNKKRQNKRPRQAKNSQPEPEIPVEQPQKQARPVSQRSSQEQAQAFRRAEQIHRRRRSEYSRPLTVWDGFEDTFYAFSRYSRGRRNAGFIAGIIAFSFLYLGNDAFRRYSPVRLPRERVQQETRTQENAQAQQQTSAQNFRVSNENRAFYLKNFSAVSQVILLLQAEGRYCSFTSLGLANCFATQLNVSRQSGNILYLADGATYTFDCENQKCTLSVDVNINNAEVMPIPLSADADGNIVINRKDVERFLND